jgi:hypothetical protein
MGPFFSDLGPTCGLVRYRDVDGPIRVFGDPFQSAPIGEARCIGWDAAGSAVWQLLVDEEAIEERWVIVDGEFVSAGAGLPEAYGSDLHAEPDTRRRRPVSVRTTPG